MISTFTVDHNNWTDFEILAHSRNNNLYVKSGQQLIYNEPNPFTDQISITFSKPGRYDISIIDMTGREVYRQKMDATRNSVSTLPLIGLTPGIYTLHTGNPLSKPIRIVRT